MLHPQHRLDRSPSEGDQQFVVRPPPDVVDALEQDLVDARPPQFPQRCRREARCVRQQPSRRTKLDNDDEPLATAVVAGCRANSPGLAVFDLTVDCSDSNTVFDSAVLATAMLISCASRRAVIASPDLMESFAPLIEGGDVRASIGKRSPQRKGFGDIQRESEVELAIDTPREEMGEPAMPADFRRRRLVLVGGPNEDAEVVNELRRERGEHRDTPEFG